MGRKKKVYSFYKGDEEIAFGTKEEIAEKLGIKRNTVEFYIFNSYKKRQLNRKSIEKRKELFPGGKENEND